ncbi:MAG: HDIG domain-containing metalloprotein [Candidatus Nanoarchaeia archaeon]
MELPISREGALKLIDQYNKNRSDITHYLESEVIMGALANRLGEDEDYWKMLGLLHDIDWGLTKEDTAKHLTKAPELLKEAGFDEKFVKVVLSHGYGWDCAGLKDKKRTEKVEFALACSETITGLIHAYALMRKGIADMEVKGLKKKMKDKKFAAGVNRDSIRECENLGLTLEEFLEISIKAIQSIADEVGL